ncbi:MAG: hypothetical protein Kow0088_25720 [Anaerolineales bacterium]
MDLIKLCAVASNTAGEAFSPPLSGLIHKVRLVYGNNPGTQADVTLTAQADPPGEFIINRPNAATNKTFYPRRAVQDALGNSLTLDGIQPLSEPYAVHGRLCLTLKQANPGSQCTAYIWLLRV